MDKHCLHLSWTWIKKSREHQVENDVIVYPPPPPPPPKTKQKIQKVTFSWSKAQHNVNPQI